MRKHEQFARPDLGAAARCLSIAAAAGDAHADLCWRALYCGGIAAGASLVRSARLNLVSTPTWEPSPASLSRAALSIPAATTDAADGERAAAGDNTDSKPVARGATLLRVWGAGVGCGFDPAASELK